MAPRIRRFAVVNLLASLNLVASAQIMDRHSLQLDAYILQIRAQNPPDKIAGLIAALRDPRESVRLSAIESLRDLGDRRAVPPLIAILSGGSEPERAAAAEALGSLRDPRAVGPLIAALESVDPNHSNPNISSDRSARCYAALSLGEIADPRAAKPLAKYIGDFGQRVRSAAAIALYHLENAHALGPLLGDLNSSDASTRATAEAALLMIGALPATVPAADIASTDTGVRYNAINTLARINDPAAIPPLIEAFHDANPNNRFFALQAVQQKRDPRLIGPLLAVMEDPNGGHDKVHAAQILRNFPASGIVTPMIAALRDPNEYIRSAAAQTLALVKDPRAIEPLIAAIPTLKSERWLNDDMNSAQLALVAIGAPSVQPLLAVLQAPDANLRRRAAKTLAVLKDRRAVEPIASLLSAPDQTVRREAAFDLADFHDPRAIDPLLALAQPGAHETREVCLTNNCSATKTVPDTDRKIDYDAFYALARSNDPRAIDFLLEQLTSNAPNVRTTAVRALGESNSSQAVDPLITLLNDGNKDVRRDAVTSLGKIHDPRAVQPLILVLSKSKGDAATQALAALREFRDPREIPALIEILQAPSYYGDAVIKDLIAFGPVAVTPLLDALRDPTPRVRQSAAAVLAAINDPRALAPLLQALERGDLPVIAGAHTFFLQRKDLATRKAVVEALKANGDIAMADDLLNSCDSGFEHAGEEWAVNHDLAISTAAGLRHAYLDIAD
jgi:HEAT repeat protein